jgi:hypothetical protein
MKVFHVKSLLWSLNPNALLILSVNAIEFVKLILIQSIMNALSVLNVFA